MATTQTALIIPAKLPGLSREATTYAIRELARRAGVNADFLASWKIDFPNLDFVDVYVQAGSNKRLRFPRTSVSHWSELYAGVFHTSTAGSYSSIHASTALDSNYKIPFSSSDGSNVGPLFIRESENSFECPVDLPLSTVFTLSRFEETLPGPRDLHGRFSAFSSIAWRDGFLHRPIVDEYGVAIEQVLKDLLPGWKPTPRQLRVKLSHDVDEIGIPFSFRGALAKTFRDHMPLATARDLLAPALRTDTAYQLYLRRIVQLSLDRQIDCSVYWKSSESSDFDTGYDPRDPRILKLIYQLRYKNVEMGIHPSYATFESFELLRSQVDSLRSLFGTQQLGGRQDYLRWSPQTWQHWDRLGLAYDSSVGFADHVGFRAGTAFPYRPWLWAQQRQADLVEIPLHAMDSTLQGYMKLAPDQVEPILRDLLARCRAVGGVFTLSWHNTRILDRRFAAAYRNILDEIAGSPTFDWRSLRS
jgi:hypothetical protein